MKIWLLIFSFFIFAQAHGFELREHAMGDTCYFIRQKTSGTRCHPTNVAREDLQFVFGKFLFSEGTHQANNWRRVLEGDATPAQIISLIEDNRESYIANETEIGYVGNSWAISFKPYELWVETRVQNPSYPYAHVDAGIAHVLALDFGHYLNDELSVGVKLEAASMQTLKRSFFVADLAIDPDAVNTDPDQKTHIVASPGIAFEPADAWGDARYSVLWKQSYIESAGVLYAGVSYLHEFTVGTLEWGLGTKFQESVAVRPQIFTYYQIGMTTLTTSISPREQTYGAFLKLKGFDTGLSYYLTDNDRVLFFQFGFTL